MDNPFQSPAVISFCPGILGLERGLERTGVRPRVVAYVEIEAFIIANLVAGMESGMVDPSPIWTDAKTFDARPFRGKIHGIIGGYPCPGESTAGLREGHLYKGFIWPAIRRAIAAARPLRCFFENVDDHLTGTYPIVQRSLRNMGYAVEAGIYTAEEAGAPHERKRLFILAMENSICSGIRDRSGKADREGRRQNVRQGNRKVGAVRSETASSELVNPNSYLSGRLSLRTETQITGSQISGEEMAHPRTPRLQGLQPGELLRQGQGVSRSVTQCRPEAFPLGQGFEQREWEEARSIKRGGVCTKSGMGCAIAGYNFREDLLRAIGNSVVEQTAAIAFTDLLNKHLKTIK